MTINEINAKRDELEAKIAEIGYTDEIEAEWKALYETEMELYKKNAIAVAESETVTAFIYDELEDGWGLYTKFDGEWYHDEYNSIIKALKDFAFFARSKGIKTVNIKTEYLNFDKLNAIDRNFEEDKRREEYNEACMASAYGNDNLMRRYNRKYGIENEYSPSNPWDAPGMSVSDFIKGVTY